MEIMKLIFCQLHPPFQELTSSIPVHDNSLLQVEIPLVFSKFLIIKIESLQNEKETKRIKILSTVCYKHHSLQHIILHGLPIKEMITSKQSMSYQFCSIVINWRTARKTNG